MRPDKKINPNAHRSGAAQGKGRYYTTGLPQRHDGEENVELHTDEAQLDVPGRSVVSDVSAPADKYAGRASVTPQIPDEDAVTVELEHKEWVDPLDDDGIDLTTVTIDLRTEMREQPPEGYYQRHSSKVPGRD